MKDKWSEKVKEGEGGEPGVSGGVEDLAEPPGQNSPSVL